jgi:hypothetical protein
MVREALRHRVLCQRERLARGHANYTKTKVKPAWFGAWPLEIPP